LRVRSQWAGLSARREDRCARGWPSGPVRHFRPSMPRTDIGLRLQESTRAALEKTYGRVPGDATRPLRVELIGRMPSSLPDHWRKCAPR
jgi:hypothetical protein